MFAYVTQGEPEMENKERETEVWKRAVSDTYYMVLFRSYSTKSCVIQLAIITS